MKAKSQTPPDPMPTPTPEPPPVPTPTPDPTPPTEHINNKMVASLFIVALSIPILAMGVYKRQLVEKTGPPVLVKIHPGEIAVNESNAPVYLSALAYDAEGRQIKRNIKYEWGMSSTQSVGTLESNNDLATFYPKAGGTGDIYVNAIAADGQAMGAIAVAICLEDDCPNPADDVAGATTESEEDEESSETVDEETTPTEEVEE